MLPSLANLRLGDASPVADIGMPPKRKGPPNFTEDSRVRPEYRKIFASHEFPPDSQVNAALFIRQRILREPFMALHERLQALMPTHMKNVVYEHVQPEAEMMQQLLSSTPNEAAMIRTMSKLAQDVVLLSNAVVDDNTGIAGGVSTKFERDVDIHDRVVIVDWAMKLVDQLKTLHLEYLMVALPFFPAVPNAWASLYSNGNYDMLLIDMEEKSAAAATILEKMRDLRSRMPVEEVDASITPPVVTSVGAPRGGRMPYEKDKFYSDRMSRLTASLLPFWMGLPGNFSAIGRDKIVRILNANSGRWVLPVENPYAREMLNWGINNENNGIYAYMEITRKLVGLGSTRIRDPLATEQRITDDPDETRWEWSDLLGSTPDGFIYDLDVGDPGFADLGLLEIKCPAYKQITPRGMMRRHDVEYHIKPETNYYILLQLWEQLETCPGALYVDLVNWKRDKPYEEGRGEQYIWIQRLYRDDVKHASIKKMLQSSFGEFARALRAIEDDASDGTRDEEAEAGWQEDRAGARMTQRQRGDKEMSVPGYTAATFSQADRQKLRDELDAWVYGSMRWQNTLEPPYYPWRSKASLDLAGMPLTGLACRYCLSNGETATHFGISGDSGYRVLPVNARSLYDTEVL